jgi:S1-C subfamily serine protease
VAVAIASAILLIGCGGDDDETATTATTQQDEAPQALEALGVTFAPAIESGSGAVVESVQEPSTRLKVGDVITAVGSTPVETAEDVVREVGTPGFGDRVELEVRRGSRKFALTIVLSPTAYLGAEVRDPKRDEEGAVAVSVQPGSPAARAGVRQGDVITTFDGEPVEDVETLLDAIAAQDVGDSVSLGVLRGSRQLELDATLAERPAKNPAD